MLLSKHTLGNAAMNGPGGSNIKSVQYGASAITSSSTSINITITSVNINNPVVIIQPYRSGSNATPALFFARGLLSDATTLTVDRGGTGGTTSFRWWVIEFNNIKSLQKGQNTSDTANITAVNTAKSVIFYSLKSSDNTSRTIDYGSCSTTFNSTTQIALQSDSALSAGSWYVAEFN